MAAIEALGERGLGIEGIHVRVHDRQPIEVHRFLDIRRDIFFSVEDLHLDRGWHCASRGAFSTWRIWSCLILDT